MNIREILYQKMSLLVLLILIILPSFSTSASYGLIRNASIKLQFPLPTDRGYRLTFDTCTKCLCEAYSNTDKVYLFTCTEKSPKFLCEFYYYMPYRDEIDYPRSDATIYLMKNETFEERYDCCNTTILVQQIKKVTPGVPMIGGKSRFLVFGDNNTILAISDFQLHGFNRLNLTNINMPALGSFLTIGYCDGKYYFNQGKNIVVYDETLSAPLYSITLNKGDITTIRFLNATQMLVAVGTNNPGIYIFEKASRTDNFIAWQPISETDGGETHAIGIINETAFYVGWRTTRKGIELYSRDENNKWYRDPASSIATQVLTTDIFIDQCQRIWVAEDNQDKIHIYDSNRAIPVPITVNAKVFNLLILEDQNYKLITSHNNGIYYIQPAINCLPF